MSSAVSRMIFNMQPVMNELCAIEDACPRPTAQGHQPSRAVSSGASRLSSSTSSSAAQNGLSSDLAFKTLEISDYENLVFRLTDIAQKNLVPQAFKSSAVDPFLRNLRTLGKSWFTTELQREERPIERAAHAILQNFDPRLAGPLKGSTEALREVISDMYQVFLQKKCQINQAVCQKIPSPLPNWYSESLSTYGHFLKELGVGVSIVNVPSRYAQKGAITWGCLGHEVAGHDILGAYPKALPEIEALLKQKLKSAHLENTAPYWIKWLQEGAADVLGVLNMGPAAGLSLIAFLRTLGSQRNFRLSHKAFVKDTHPVDLVRGYLAAYSVDYLATEEKPFAKGREYANALLREAQKDANEIPDENGIKYLQLDVINLGDDSTIEANLRAFCIHEGIKISAPKSHKKLIEEMVEKVCDGCLDSDFEERLIAFMVDQNIPQTRAQALKITNGAEMQVISNRIPLDDFIRSSKIFVETIMHDKLLALDGFSFYDIKSWTDQDEKICGVFRKLIHLEPDEDPVATYKDGFFASHVVSAAVLESMTLKTEAAENDTHLQKIFSRMVAILRQMHKANKEWKIEKTAQIVPFLQASPINTDVRNQQRSQSTSSSRSPSYGPVGNSERVGRISPWDKW